MSRQDHYTLTLSRLDHGSLAEVDLQVWDGDGGRRHVRVGGGRVATLADPLRRLLADAGLPGRTWTGTAPIELDRRCGERVELLLRAVKPLRRHDRVESVAEDVVAMSAEEAAYWHAKWNRPGALRALRVLLTGGR